MKLLISCSVNGRKYSQEYVDVYEDLGCTEEEWKNLREWEKINKVEEWFESEVSYDYEEVED